MRWIASSGGPSPDANEVSLEDDLRELMSTLGDDGVVLYAGGPGTRAVQVSDDPERGDALTARLGMLFAPRGARDARYRETTLELNGPATRERFAEELTQALSAIDRLERDLIESYRYRRYAEAYPWLAAAAFVCWLVVLALEATWWRTAP